MATILYTQKDNGDLKFVAEVDTDDPAIALDALLDERPRLARREFVAIHNEALVVVEAESDEIVNPRRNIIVTQTVNGKSKKATATVEPEEVEEEEDETDEQVAEDVELIDTANAEDGGGVPDDALEEDDDDEGEGGPEEEVITPPQKRPISKKSALTPNHASAE